MERNKFSTKKRINLAESNVIIALNNLYAKKEKIHPAYVSKITQIVKNKLLF